MAGSRLVSFRLILVCLIAFSASLPMAWISISKLLLFVAALGYLVTSHFFKRQDPALERLWTPKVTLAIVIVFSLSLLWTEGSTDIALLALVKHAKVLEVLLLVILIRTAREARVGVLAFALGQIFVLTSSWLLVVGIQVPWIKNALNKYVVFSSYLDQSIMLATATAIFWHLRGEKLWPRWLGAALALAALVNALLLLKGRTGYLVALAMLSLAAMWAMPKRFRIAALVGTPLLVLFGLYLGSEQVQGRLKAMVTESQNYTGQVQTDSSSGWRLNAWNRSLQAISQEPWVGHGVGSWTIAVKRLQGTTAVAMFGEGNASNPHQEFLLWAVQLGVLGPLFLMGWMFCIGWDARLFPAPVARATWSVVMALGVACTFNSTLYDALIGDFFCVLLGLLVAYGLRSPVEVSKLATGHPEHEHAAAGA